MLDQVAALGVILHNLAVNGGGTTRTFPYVSWGKHLGTPGDFVTVHQRGGPGGRPSDIGGGAWRGQEAMDVHVFAADSADLTDADLFRQAVIEAVAAKVRAAEKTLGSSWFTDPMDYADRTSKAGSVLAFHYVITVRARVSEVYA